MSDAVSGAWDTVSNAVGDVVSNPVVDTAALALATDGGSLLADAAPIAADAGAIDLGGGISLGADGSVLGGTFTGGSGLTGNAATDALTGLSSDMPSVSDILSGAKQVNSAMGLGKQLMGLGGGAAAGSRAGVPAAGGNSSNSSAPANNGADNSFLSSTPLSYTAVDASPKMLNPVLANLAGVGTQAPIQSNNSDLLLGTSQGEQPKSDVPESFAQGGLTAAHPLGEPEFYSEGGLGNMYIEGKGDGTSDEIPAMVANNEFVIPADIVSALGNGSSEAGGSVLDQFVKNIREHKHSNPPDELPPPSKGPLEYLSQKGRA